MAGESRCRPSAKLPDRREDIFWDQDQKRCGETLAQAMNKPAELGQRGRLGARSFIFPLHRLHGWQTFSPEPHACDVDSGHNPHSSGLGIKCRMLQKASDVEGDLGVFHIQVNQPVGVMAKASLEKVLILREERCAMKPVQERNQVFVFNSAVRNLPPNLPERNSPRSQECALIVANVFVEQIHAASRLARRHLNRP